MPTGSKKDSKASSIHEDFVRIDEKNYGLSFLLPVGWKAERATPIPSSSMPGAKFVYSAPFGLDMGFTTIIWKTGPIGIGKVSYIVQGLQENEEMVQIIDNIQIDRLPTAGMLSKLKDAGIFKHGVNKNGLTYIFVWASHTKYFNQLFQIYLEMAFSIRIRNI